MSADLGHLSEHARRGIALCRAERWQEGIALLSEVVGSRTSSTEIPGLVFSFLGYGVARYQNRGKEGLALCEHAVKSDFYRGDAWYNLVRVRLLLKQRAKAVEALRRGLAADPQHAGLVKLRAELGVRRPPVLGFLSRDSAINKLLGRLRHALAG